MCSSRLAVFGVRSVPAPTVPTSILGIAAEIYFPSRPIVLTFFSGVPAPRVQRYRPPFLALQAVLAVRSTGRSLLIPHFFSCFRRTCGIDPTVLTPPWRNSPYRQVVCCRPPLLVSQRTRFNDKWFCCMALPLLIVVFQASLSRSIVVDPRCQTTVRRHDTNLPTFYFPLRFRLPSQSCSTPSTPCFRSIYPATDSLLPFSLLPNVCWN